MVNRAFCFLLIILLCSITPNDLFAKEELKNKNPWWIETTVILDDGIILNRSTKDNYTPYENYEECMAVLKATKIYGATGGDAQVVVILKCVARKKTTGLFGGDE